jgi:hypothetical protein
VVTDEVQADLQRLGWAVVTDPDESYWFFLWSILKNILEKSIKSLDLVDNYYYNKISVETLI